MLEDPSLFPIFLVITVALFLVRWIINWEILNKQNATNFSFFKPPRLMADMLHWTKHTFLSEWILYWKNEDNNCWKRTSNFLSLLTFIALFFTFYTFKR
ncbi:hypothetical protein CNR22_01350 [Sphingobacteriaceae bacterium]|nr:hypothetical protein CNR22_01350 [Sphingobacteriaceae bacterium]